MSHTAPFTAFRIHNDDAGYRGVLGLESFTGENATIAVAASVWRPLAPSQDDLAARSIAHLRALGA